MITLTFRNELDLKGTFHILARYQNKNSFKHESGSRRNISLGDDLVNF